MIKWNAETEQYVGGIVAIEYEGREYDTVIVPGEAGPDVLSGCIYESDPDGDAAVFVTAHSGPQALPVELGFDGIDDATAILFRLVQGPDDSVNVCMIVANPNVPTALEALQADDDIIVDGIKYSYFTAHGAGKDYTQ